MTKTIDITNIGPIAKLSIPLPDAGGVVVLKGRQGDGKSTALKAIAAAAGRAEKSLTVRDGQKSGSIELGGAKLTVSRSRQTKAGELEIDAIEGRFDVGKLIDPQIADDERADASRIKQLLALTGARADIGAYRQMLAAAGLGVEIDEETDDPIELYRRVKKACDQSALSCEKEAALLPEVAAGAPSDDVPTVAQALKEQELAAVTLAQMRQAAADAARHQTAHADAMRRVAELEAQQTRETPAELQVIIGKHEQALAGMVKDLEMLQERIASERQLLRDAVTAYKDSKHQDDLLKEARTTLERLSDVAIGPSPNELETAEMAAKHAREATQGAVIAQQARESFEALKAKVDKRHKLEATADVWRKMATKCEDVLAKSLPNSALRVDGSRLVCRTDRSSSELYSDLSHGERAIVAIGIVSEFLPPHGIATISQEVWSGISGENQKKIHDEARKKQIVIVTADVTDSDLSIEEM